MKRLALLVALALSLNGCLFGAQLGEHAAVQQAGRETTRDFLVDAQPEGEGYGLYSYLLLGAPPSAASRERCLSTIMAYMEDIPVASDSERYLPRWQLNITYLPVMEAPPAQFVHPEGQRDLAAAADWMLQHYNYARARALLRLLPGDHYDGPYLLSQSKPLSGSDHVMEPFLYQDLSNVQPELAGTWIKEFMAQAAKPTFWTEAGAIRKFALQLRNLIATAAVATPSIEAGLAKWIKTP